MMDELAGILDDQIKAGKLQNFPGSIAIRQEFLKLAESLCTNIDGHGICLTPEQKTGLIIKLGKYVAKRQWNFFQVKEELLKITDAITGEPQALTDPRLTLTRILEAHRTRNLEAASKLRRELLLTSDTTTPPPVISHSADTNYRLIECITQRHLQEQTAALGHCVGGTHLDYYCGKLLRGASRIFSLCTSTGNPLLTIEYDIKTKTITQIEGKPDQGRRFFLLNTRHIFFPALCEALHDLGFRIDIRKINFNNYGLVPPQLGSMVVTKNNGIIPCDQADITDVVYGRVKVDNRCSLELIHQMASSPLLTLDITDLEPALLPARVNCDLTSEAIRFIAPQIQTCGSLEIPKALSVDLGSLVIARNLDARSATVLHIPHLRESWDIDVSAIGTLDAPKLTTYAGITSSTTASINTRHFSPA